MSEKTETPKKKTTASPHRSEMEDMPIQQTVSPRKRKAETSDDREPSMHEAASLAMHAGPMSRGGRRSNPVPIPPHMEPQRQRNLETLPDAHRRMSMDIHRPRRPNMPNSGGPRPVRTRRSTMPSGPPRTMLQRRCFFLEKVRDLVSLSPITTDAWHTALNSDPLVDSDEERPDEHIRLDYNRRMQVITRLRGRPPTPPTERTQTTDAAPS